MEIPGPKGGHLGKGVRMVTQTSGKHRDHRDAVGELCIISAVLREGIMG
jgi:hypothetical protein